MEKGGMKLNIKMFV